MLDGRAGAPRRSSGSFALEASQSSQDLACLLRTNPLLYPGPVSPERRKVASYLVAGPPHCPDQQPRAPFVPPGSALSGPWLPFSLVPLPPRLVFETYWHEGPHQRINMHVTYDTATKRCLAGTYVSLDMEVTTPAGGPIDELDVHVGAEVRVAGKRVTLRKPLTLATQTWLDQQARAMLVAKYRIESELSKFRPVVPVPSQFPEPKRAESIDIGSHQHMPAGGRVNLRALYDAVVQLAEQLRQHRGRLPPLPDAAERVAAAAAAAPGPPDWSPERREAERREAEARQREAAAAGPTDEHTWRNDLPNWIESIPLAASCCSRYAAKVAEAGNRSGKGGEKDHHHGHHHGHHRGHGHRSVRASAAGMLAGGGGSGGSGGAGSGSGGGGSTLAFNLSVLNKLAAMAALSGSLSLPTATSVGTAGGATSVAATGSVGSAGGGAAAAGAAASAPSQRVGSPAGLAPPRLGSGGPTTPRTTPMSQVTAPSRQR